MQNLEIISVNIWNILISLANLVILFLILKHFLFKPVKKVMDERAKSIQDGYDNAEKAQSCLIMGVLVAVLSVAGNIISNVLSSSFNITNYITGLIIPALYIVGAVRNKSEA